MSAADPRDRAVDHEPRAPKTERDPVCGMHVDPTVTPHRAEHAGQRYFFCGAKCRERFVAEPDRYLSEHRANHEPPAAGALWTCPMHPQIVRNATGSCTICGMALEPTTPAAGGEAENPELRDLTRRF